MTGKIIRERIYNKKMTLRQVADRIGISYQSLQIRLKVQNISTGTLESIAEAIGEPVSYFYNELPILTLEDYAKVANLNTEIAYLRQLLKEREHTIYLLQELLNQANQRLGK